MLRQPVERACTRSLVLKLRQACRGAGVAGANRRGSSPPWAKPAFACGSEPPCGVAMKPRTTAPCPMASANTWSLEGSFSTSVTQAGERIGLRPKAQGVGRRHTVRLGEHHVEADSRGPIVGELLHELGKHGARPRPLPDAFQRLLVDVDDAQRQAGVELARADLLVGIEHHGPQSRHRARIPDAQDERCCNHCPDNEGIEQTRTYHCRRTPRDLNTSIRASPARRLKPSRWRPRASMSNGHWGSGNRAVICKAR